MSSPPVQIMAILNITPDSFSDGGRLFAPEITNTEIARPNTSNLETASPHITSLATSHIKTAMAAAEKALNAGATILDVGGESTRPGAQTIPETEECSRVIPVIQELHQRFPEVMISIDTRKASVAEAALRAGARMVNDVSGLQYDPAMADVVARHQAWLVLMHSQGTPETMQQTPHYPQGVVADVYAFFERQLAYAERAGIRRERIILDPGFGFGKTVAHNLTLLGQLGAFQTLGCPILAGTSRKSFLTLGKSEILPDQREALTAASLALAIQQGARYVRVHDVETQAPVVRLTKALRKTLTDHASSSAIPVHT